MQPIKINILEYKIQVGFLIFILLVLKKKSENNFLNLNHKLYSRFCMVFTCLALSVFSTIEEYEDQAIEILFHMEIVVVIWFSIEFALR
jgi:hypothetical protein